MHRVPCHLQEAVASGQVQVGAVALDVVTAPATGGTPDGAPHLAIIEPVAMA